MNYRQFRPNSFNSFFKKTQQSRFFTSAAHLQRLRMAQKNIYGFQCASFFGLNSSSRRRWKVQSRKSSASTALAFGSRKFVLKSCARRTTACTLVV